VSLKHPIQPVAVPLSYDALRRLQLELEAMIAAAGAAGVTLFNGRSGSVALTEADVLDVLGPGHMPISIVGLPEADAAEPLLRFILTEGMDFVGGTGTAGIAATSPSVLRFRKNGVANGTATFTGTAGAIAITDPYADGDLFELYPPAVIDATLDQVSITLETT
jgi:hypothetical protein